MEKRTEHRIIYAGLGLAVVVLLAWGLVAFEHRKESDEARQKADRLVALYEERGLPTPEDTDQVVTTLGTDGGQVCSTATDDLAQGLFKLGTFVNSGAPGGRPTTLDRDVIDGGALIVEVYCPDKLAAYQQFVNDDLDTESGVVDLN